MISFDQFVTFLYTNDMAASSAFYSELLELPLVLDQGTCRIYQVCTNAFLGICARKDQPTPSKDSRSVILTLVTNDVDAVYTRLIQRGVHFEKPPTQNNDYQIYHCFLSDPDGYLIEIQRFLDPAWSARS